MSKRRRRQRRSAVRVPPPKISIPPSGHIRQRDAIPTDYTQVITDLKLIGLLAAVILVGLVILSYLLFP